MAEPTNRACEDNAEVSGGVRLPGGTKFDGRLKGYRLGDLVMALTFLYVFVGKPLWDNYKGVPVDHSVESLAREHKAILDSNERLERAVDSVVYVLTLDDRERKSLNLRMPDALRERQAWRAQDKR